MQENNHSFDLENETLLNSQQSKKNRTNLFIFLLFCLLVVSVVANLIFFTKQNCESIVDQSINNDFTVTPTPKLVAHVFEDEFEAIECELNSDALCEKYFGIKMMGWDMFRLVYPQDWSLNIIKKDFLEENTVLFATLSNKDMDIHIRQSSFTVNACIFPDKPKPSAEDMEYYIQSTTDFKKGYEVNVKNSKMNPWIIGQISDKELVVCGLVDGKYYAHLTNIGLIDIKLEDPFKEEIIPEIRTILESIVILSN
ncbi:MAG: hypothetical protein GF390_02295 [Candidatus Pacebacteria bacterium]|nr:hypothetical protein [Candidatus Paceibacterota bacterium]